MSSKVGPSVEDLAQRVNALETQLERAEADEEWDALEPELIQLRAAIFREISADRVDLEKSRTEHQKTYGWLARFNPFDSGARDKWNTTVSRKQFALESAEGIEDRVRQLTAKFYADKTKKFARELIRVIEKIQRGIGGSWDLKAGAAAGALFAQASGEAALARGEKMQQGLLAAGFILEGQVAAAAGYSALEPEQAVSIAKQIRDALRGKLGDGAEGLAIAALVAGKSAGEALHVAQLVMDARGGDRGANALIAAAILLSGERPELALGRVADDVPRGGSAMARARVAAAAILSGRSAEEIRAYAAAAADELRFDPERGSMHLAAAILSPHDPKDAFVLAREAKAEARGSDTAEAAIVSAAIMSRQPPAESLAIAKHLQSALTGTWESEALILGAAIIALGMRGHDAHHPGTARLAGAYLVPGWTAPPIEE